MISLIIKAQDIKQIELGLIEENTIKQRATFSTEPDGYLKAIDRFLQNNKLKTDNLTRVYVVTGPGSFTASRVSTTIANSFLFSTNVQVIPIDNPNEKTLSEIVSGLDTTKQSRGWVQPTYNKPPNITTPKSL